MPRLVRISFGQLHCQLQPGMLRKRLAVGEISDNRWVCEYQLVDFFESLFAISYVKCSLSA